MLIFDGVLLYLAVPNCTIPKHYQTLCGDDWVAAIAVVPAARALFNLSSSGQTRTHAHVGARTSHGHTYSES